MRLLAVVMVVAPVGVFGCVGDDPVNPPTGQDGGSSGASGTSGSSGATAAKLAFVTKASFNGQLGGANGGVQAGDDACTREATTAGRGGTFHALLSKAGASAVDRISAGPWKLSDQTPVPAKANFAAGGVLINRDASGGLVSNGDKVWTGSDGAGGPDSLTCSGWTDGQGVGNGRAGSVGGAGETWISSDNQPCSDSRPIYCFED